MIYSRHANRQRYEPEPVYFFDGSDSEFRAFSAEIEALEDEYGVELTDDQFRETIVLAAELGDAGRALHTLIREGEAAAAEFDEWFDEGVAEKAKELGRKITQPEQKELRDKLNEDPDLSVSQAWLALHGRRYSDEAIQRVEDEYKQQIADMRAVDDNGVQRYSDEYIAAYEAEHRPRLEDRIAKMRRSGKGQFDLDDPKGRDEYIAATLADGFEAAANEEEGLPADTSPDDRREHVVARLEEEGASSADLIDAKLGTGAYAPAREDEVPNVTFG